MIEFFEIFSFLNRFRLIWRLLHIKNFTKILSYTHNKDEKLHVYCLECKDNFFKGWYIIEAEVNSKFLHVGCTVTLSSSAILEFKFPLHSKMICKRLIYISNTSSLAIRYSTCDPDLIVKNLTIKRVSQKFAQVRMSSKLRSSHSLYRKAIDSGSCGTSLLSNKEFISKMWLDYCSIFEEKFEAQQYSLWADKVDQYSVFLKASNVRSCRSSSSYPAITLVMPVFNPALEWLEKAVESVRNQIFEDWELCIADDASSDPSVRNLIKRLAMEDDRIKFFFRAENGHISAASNSALALGRSKWIALLDHDDLLVKDALFLVAEAISKNPTCRMIYSDEDKIDEGGKRSDPYFKSEWNQDLFYSQNMFSHLGVYQTSLVREVGGFRLGYEGSQDYDLALRCIERIKPSQIHHIPHVLYHWRIHADSTAHSSDAKPYAMVAGERALNDHFGRLGVKAKAESVGHGYRVRYALPDQLPMVSLIIPTRNGGKLLRQCVDSILAKTSYATYEIIIVDNGSDERATLRYLESISADPRIRVLRDPRPFNYSALNNAAVKLARGDVIGLVNDDVEVINPDWLSEMVSHALRPEVGAVGARLWYSDDTIQHAGVVLGINGIAGHVHRYLPKGNVGYCGRAALIQAFSAVTGACLVVRKAVYDEVGGLDEALAVACNDIDFCLRLRAAGYRNIYTPYAELYHHESASRGFDDTPEKQARSAKEVAFMQARWGSALLNDPCYNPNLTLDFEDFSLAWPPRLPPFVQAEQATRLGEVEHHEV